MFDNLMQVEHPNIVKFHKYWLDMKESQARVSLSFSPVLFYSTLTQELTVFFFHLWHTGYIHHRIHVIRQPQAIPEEN